MTRMGGYCTRSAPTHRDLRPRPHLTAPCSLQPCAQFQVSTWTLEHHAALPTRTLGCQKSHASPSLLTPGSPCWGHTSRLPALTGSHASPCKVQNL